MSKEKSCSIFDYREDAERRNSGSGVLGPYEKAASTPCSVGDYRKSEESMERSNERYEEPAVDRASAEEAMKKADESVKILYKKSKGCVKEDMYLKTERQMMKSGLERAQMLFEREKEEGYYGYIKELADGIHERTEQMIKELEESKK